MKTTTEKTAAEAVAELAQLLRVTYDACGSLWDDAAPDAMKQWRKGRLDGLLDAANMADQMASDLAKASDTLPPGAPDFPSDVPIPFALVDEQRTSTVLRLERARRDSQTPPTLRPTGDA